MNKLQINFLVFGHRIWNLLDAWVNFGMNGVLVYPICMGDLFVMQ